MRSQAAQFPGKGIIVVENGCIRNADGIPHEIYLTQHFLQVQRAVADGIPVDAYLSWAITSNREWGLPFDANSDFGLYLIDLDRDSTLTRNPTEASRRYQEIIAARSAAAQSGSTSPGGSGAVSGKRTGFCFAGNPAQPNTKAAIDSVITLATDLAAFIRRAPRHPVRWLAPARSQGA